MNGGANRRKPAGSRHAPRRSRSLDRLIERLGEVDAEHPYDGPEITPAVLKVLLAQFILDEQPDTEPRRPGRRLKLQALDILREIVTQEGAQDNAAELLALLGGGAVDPSAAGD